MFAQFRPYRSTAGASNKRSTRNISSRRDTSIGGEIERCHRDEHGKILTMKKS